MQLYMETAGKEYWGLIKNIQVDLLNFANNVILTYVFLPLSFQNSCSACCVLRDMNAIHLAAVAFIDLVAEWSIH